MSAGARGMGAESRVTLAELEPQPVLPVPSHVRSEVLASGAATMRGGVAGRSSELRGSRSQG
jgi:hypothetical protein